MSNRRKRQIQNQQPQPKESRPFQFTAKETQPSTQLEATFEKEGEILSYTYQDWHLKFKGSDNLYPQTLAWAYRNAPTHRAIIESIVAMAKGNGLSFTKDGEPAQLFELSEESQRFISNPSGQAMYDLNDLYEDLLRQWKIYGENWVYYKSSIVRGQRGWCVKYIDAAKPRLLRKEPKAIITPFWRDIKNNNGNAYLKPGVNSKVYPIWDMLGAIPLDEEFITYKKRREPEYDIYGVPDYVACLKACVIEYMCDTYNQNRLENGFFADIFVTYFGSPPEGMEASEWLEYEYKKLKGAHNAGKPRILHAFDRDTAPQVDVINDGKDGEFLDAKKDAFDSIVRAHRFFPKLAGLSVSGELGGNQELMNMHRIVMGMVVIPNVQNPVLEQMNKILESLDMEFRVYVDNVSPIGLDDRIDPEKELTQNEKRAILNMPELDEDELDEDDRIGHLTNMQIDYKLKNKKTDGNN